MERVRDDEDDPFVSLADIEQDIAQALEADLTVLKKKKKMVIKLISKLRSTNLLTLILKLLLLMDD